MPELPEITLLARDMQKELAGRKFGGIEVLQPKCLNVPVEEYQTLLTGAEVLQVTSHGKWLKLETTRGWLLLNLGMGGEILLTQRDSLPEKHRLIFDFDDGDCLAVNFWKWISEAILSLEVYRRYAGLCRLSMACNLWALPPRSPRGFQGELLCSQTHWRALLS